ncbi:MAG: accessory factor UbiK family protein [Rhizobiales bacterium]|nr:accessory factor UbiK family protein [Hyphomicrobiales bacterium]
MSQPTNRLLDEFAKLMTDVADVAQGFKREADNVVKSQLERFLSELDLVTREDFDAVKAMAAKAREENEALSVRLDALEKTLAKKATGSKSA